MQQKDPIPRDPRAGSAGKRGGKLHLHLRGNPGYLRRESRPGIIEEDLIDSVMDWLSTGVSSPHLVPSVQESVPSLVPLMKNIQVKSLHTFLKGCELVFQS